MVVGKQSCFIIAEAGVNHNGRLDWAKKLVDTAASAGANAVKFQTFKAENLVTKNAPKADYQVENTGSNESQLEMLKKLELPFEFHRVLKDYCFQKDILFLSTPFDFESLEFLDSLDLPFFKVPSGEITNIPFLERIAAKKRPMIVSTGMSTLEEVGQALKAIRGKGNEDVILLHCVSQYPANPREANLRAMLAMKEAFGLPVGYSDHTPGIEVALAAVALGACVIEKHFTLDKTLPGPDHKASLDPRELAEMVRGIRVVESSLGSGKKEPAPCEADTRAVARKSLTAAEAIPAGSVLTEKMIAIKRPGTGLSPALFEQLVGRRTKQEIAEGELFSMEMFES